MKKIFIDTLFWALVVACLADLWMISLPITPFKMGLFLAFVFVLKAQWLVREAFRSRKPPEG